MKKLFAVAILAVMTLSANAQDFKKFRFGPTVGLNIATTTDAVVGSRVGFSVGALAEYNFTDNFFMTGALKFSQKGGKYDEALAGVVVKNSANPGYIELPIHAGYRYSFGQFSIFGEFGPYLAVGVCGKAKMEALGQERSIDYFGDPSDPDDNSAGVKRFDFGLGVAAGAEYKKCQLRIGYDFGLTGLENYDVPAPFKKSKNRNFYVALSYMF